MTRSIAALALLALATIVPAQQAAAQNVLGGAIVGALIGGKKGAAIGATVGGGGGTAYVLSTPGKEIRLGKGATVSVRLAEPLTVRVRG